jgi:glycosyltransferase involved in cell wall biosynthesis
MWLLNHGTARDFEIPMLKGLGFREIFLPKVFPQEVKFRSASLCTAQDSTLTIPADDLAVLNAADWYRRPGRDALELANRHFGVVFCIALHAELLASFAAHFDGALVLRAYGGTNLYADLIKATAPQLRRMGRRFWMGSAYAHLAAAEPEWLAQRDVFLPAGLVDCRLREDWTGEKRAVFVVCPDLAANEYYTLRYHELKEQLAGLPYAIGGQQSIQTNDPHVLGFVPWAQHERNLRDYRVMYYHSVERNHLHYHPIEAVRAGMPLVFLAGGLLDQLGGKKLPGRCSNPNEAQQKLRRILDGDRALIDRIRASQRCLLDEFRAELLEPAWRRGLDRIVSEIEGGQALRPTVRRRPRIGVLLSAPYRGGTLRSAKLLASALAHGSRQYGKEADVVLAYPESSPEGPEKWTAGLDEGISARTFRWSVFDQGSAVRAARFGGDAEWAPGSARYLVPDDGAQQFGDCDLWILVGDRLTLPLLPSRPYVLMVFDYVQRYCPELLNDDNYARLALARCAQRVLVTTRFTEQDALGYAGVPARNVVRLPMLAAPVGTREVSECPPPRYFLWTTNLASHKNHPVAAQAMQEYFGSLNGGLDCYISGVHTEALLSSELPHLEAARKLMATSSACAERIRVVGELPDRLYEERLARATFLWHPAIVDNGTLSAVEAAFLGVPCLSSRYPAMEEMNEEFGLGLTWCDARDPGAMARQLKWMEEHACEARSGLPSPARLASHDPEHLGHAYWKAVRECL